MDSVLNFGVTLITWLQSLGNWLVGPMKFFSFLGSEEFYLMIAPAILWCWDAGLGIRLGLYLMVSAGVNAIFKIFLLGPRPYWFDERVVGLASETSFGVPSGHSQNAAVVWGTLASRFGKPLIWVISIIIIFLIGLSRLVLGVHFPHDVLVGWLLGGLLLLVLFKISTPTVNWIRRFDLTKQLLIIFGGSLTLILLGIIAKSVTASFNLPSDWVNRAASAYPDVPIAPFALSGLISNAGAFFGLAGGALWLETKGGFKTRGVWWQLALRYLIGLIGVMIFWYGLGEIFPRGELVFPYILRYLRYALVGLWVTGFAPYIFRRLKLAEGHE